MSEDDIRANAVREAQAYIQRLTRRGLVPLDRVLGDLAAVAQRMENGMTARGSTRPEERTVRTHLTVDEQLEAVDRADWRTKPYPGATGTISDSTWLTALHAEGFEIVRAQGGTT